MNPKPPSAPAAPALPKNGSDGRANSVVNILLVDDEPRNLDVLESILVAPDYRLVRAQTADETLMALIREDFACIVLDIRIPVMNGIELARLIKTRKRSQHIPIIFLTAFFQEEKDVLQGYGVGAVDYLTKPVTPQILRSKVGVFVELFRTTRALTAANAALELEVKQRQQAEEALRQSNAELEIRVKARTAELTTLNRNLFFSERRYREMVHALPAAVYTCDAKGRITLFNDAAVELWGRTPKLNEDFWCGSWKIFRPDGSPMPVDECPMAVTLREGRAIRGEEIIIERPDGTRRHVLPYPEPIRDDSGDLAGAVNMLVDITMRKQIEVELRESQKSTARLAAIVESSEDAIVSKDLDGTIRTWNRGAEAIFGYTAEEAVGRPITMLIPPELELEEKRILETMRGGRRMDPFESVRLRKDGSRIYVFVAVSPVKDQNGNIVGAANITRDITRQKKAEQELERVHQEVVAASRAKDDFLAALSHELRTPLNPVLLLASEAASDPDLPPHLREQFNLISKNVSLEARLIDDLLDLTRITHGKLPIESAALNLHAVLQDALAAAQSDIRQKEITVALELKADRHMVCGDAVRLQQVFWNVLKNAVKFTATGGVITISTETPAGKSDLVIKIADTGIGLTPEEVKRIFEPFAQGEHAGKGGSHRFGGLGLGLAISRMLVELHSGRIFAISGGRGKGATFCIELPLLTGDVEKAAPVRRPAIIPGKLAAPNGIRVLLVEDHEPTRTALAQLLTRRRYTVVSAATVGEARAWAAKENFHLLLSDIGLPDGNGLELMAELRTRHGLKGIALTGYGTEEDLARTQNAGFEAHLVKPVRAQTLDNALASVLGATA